MRVNFSASARCFTARSIRRVMMNAAGYITPMNNHELLVFVNRSVAECVGLAMTRSPAMTRARGTSGSQYDAALHAPESGSD